MGERAHQRTLDLNIPQSENPYPDEKTVPIYRALWFSKRSLGV